MVDKSQTNELVRSLSENESAEEMMLSSLQALIAAEITMKRHELGMSQTEFAELMGVGQPVVSKWESGETNFTLKTLVQIASKLNMEMSVPFKMDRPLEFAGTPNNVIDFRLNNPWKVNSPSAKTSYTTLSDEELMEN